MCVCEHAHACVCMCVCVRASIHSSGPDQKKNQWLIVGYLHLPFGLVVRIPGFHPGGPGSIPGVGIPFFFQHNRQSMCKYYVQAPATNLPPG